MTDKGLREAFKALPHMMFTKTDGEYRVAYRIATIGYAKPEWSAVKCRDHQERTSYYTTDPVDALGTAKALSDHMDGILTRMADAKRDTEKALDCSADFVRHYSKGRR